MSKNIRTQIGKVIGKTLNSYHARVKPVIDDIKFKEQYQGRIIDCMVGEVDDNYIETPATDNPIVKLEHSREGIVKVPNIKGKTILVDSDGNETDTPAEGCKLVSVGEDEDNKLIILSKNKNLFPYSNISIDAKTNQTWYSLEGNVGMYGNDMWSKTKTWIYLPRGYIKVTTQELFNCGIQMVTPNEKIIPYNGNSLFEGGYVTFRLRNNDTVNKFGYKNLMFEWSQSPILNNSNYIEPKQHKTEILLDEPLRRLPNNVYDNIAKIGGKWCIVKNCKKVVVDGSENGWTLMKDNGNNITFRLHNNLVTDAYRNPPCISNLFIQDMTGGLIKADNSMRITEYSSEQRLFLVPTKDKCSDLQSFKQWLSENPVTVIYQLAEPIVEELPNGITLQGFDDTTMYIENSITPVVSYGYNAVIPYKEELSNQKEEVENNTLDIENNIIPYLMDMEYNLMLMEDN